MNFRVFALGFLVKERFQRALEIVAAEQQMLARMSMVEIAGYLRTISPRRTGFMSSTAMGWDFSRRGKWGFSFFVGWRRGQFPKIFYPVFVLYGTGVFGLYGKPIRPKSASRLAWQTPEGKWVSKAETKGQKGHQTILKRTQEFGMKMLRQNIKFAYIRSMRILERDK